MRTIAILLCLLFCLPTRAKKMDENNQIPQKDISIRFNFGIASANQEGTGESLWYSNPKKSSRGFQYGIDFLRHHKYIGYYCCPIKILRSYKIRADFICEVSPFSLDFSRQTIKSNHGQKYTF